MVEFLEYIIDNDMIEMGADDKPAIVKVVDGIEVLETGIDEFDEEEEMFRNQRPLHELMREARAKEAQAQQLAEKNLLGDLANLALKEKSKDA